jgi:tRNA U34 5-methylaminomethyl-2-thiouridine-forming methyltransferase MnmC
MQDRKTLNQTMLEHAAIQQSSGDTILNYAKLIGVSGSKLQYWVRKYKTQDRIQEFESGTGLKFIDLSSFERQNQPLICDSRSGSNEATAISPVQDKRLPQITLSFPNGMCLKIY